MSHIICAVFLFIMVETLIKCSIWEFEKQGDLVVVTKPLSPNAPQGLVIDGMDAIF